VNNPLEGIANYLSLLERTENEERRAHYVGQVRRGFQRIRDIVSELVRFARPEHDAGTADLARVVERVTQLARFSHELRDVGLEVRAGAGPFEVPGNEGRLEQVLLNLLLNAGRAAGKGGAVSVTLDRQNPTEARIVVEDDGPGLAPEDLPRVFDPFFTRSGGTGLGLSVSYGIVRAHGGELEAANGPAGGARFTLRLPRRREDVARPPGEESEREPA
jgi:signal transduction histidine kinase